MTDHTHQREDLRIVPVVGCDPLVGVGLALMQESRRRTLKTIAGIDSSFLDFQPDYDAPINNSIGTLLYHIAAIEIDWLQSEVMEGEPLPDALWAFFPYDVRDESGRLTVVSGESLGGHLGRLTAVRDVLREHFTAMSDEDYLRPRALPDYDVTPAWVLAHLTQHEAEHRAEIAALIRQYSGNNG